MANYIYVGIDVSKDTLDVCIPNYEAYRDVNNRKLFTYEKIGNNELEIERLIKTLNGKRLGLVMPVKERKQNEDWAWCIACENTGIYHKLLQKVAAKNNIKSTVLNSYSAKKWNEITAKNRKQTDKIDAYGIYSMANAIAPKATDYKQDIEELKILLAVNRRLKKNLSQTKPMKNNIQHQTTTSEKQDIEKQAKALKKAQKYFAEQREMKAKEILTANLYLWNGKLPDLEIKKVEKMLEENKIDDVIYTLQKNPILQYYQIENELEKQLENVQNEILEIIKKKYKDTYEAILSIPGVGDTVAMEMIIMTENFTKFDNVNQYLSYIGIVPTGKDSGTSVKSAENIGNLVNKSLRHVLVSATWSATKYNQDCRMIYTRLVAKEKHKSVALVAAARKLAIQIFYCGTTKEKYKSENERLAEKKVAEAKLIMASRETK